MIEHLSSVQVRYAETDMMGIVYHGSYLPWLEIGRTELLKAEGIPYRDLEAQGYFLPVLEVNVKYLRSARYDDTITILSRIAEKPGLRINIAYELRRGEELIATAATQHVFIDKAGRPVRPPAAFTARMDELFGA
ncbi:MAG: thioesterase family protein [Verrucomicrobiota bacterium]